MTLRPATLPRYICRGKARASIQSNVDECGSRGEGSLLRCLPSLLPSLFPCLDVIAEKGRDHGADQELGRVDEKEGCREKGHGGGGLEDGLNRKEGGREGGRV